MTGPMKQGRFYIMRHGETVFNASARLQSNAMHTPLTKQGFAQAAAMGCALRAELGDRPKVTLHVSDTGRALQTAALIAEELRIDWFAARRTMDLKEIDMGSWCGRSYGDVEDEVGPIVVADHLLRPAPDGENYPMIEARLHRWLGEIGDPGGDHIVVMHGMPIPGRIDPDAGAARHHAARRWPYRPDRPAAPAHPRAVRRSRAGCQGGQAARQAGVPLALPSRRHRFRGDDRHRQAMRPWLAERFVIGRPDVVEAQHSVDGTRKWLLRTADGHDFEMVFIPDDARHAVRLQPGRLHAQLPFCHTGTMKLVRNLTPGEIVGQVMLARDALGEWPRGTMICRDADVIDEAEDEAGHYTADGRLLTNIVMMGMGEPLYNFDNVRDALKLVMDGDGLALSSAASRSRPAAWCR
jgi:glucosyl-3-phosphoglycerate phosphatase